MDTFNQFHHLLSEPKKIAAFSFDENGNVMDNETENQVFLNKNVLTKENVNIDLKKNYEFYEHKVDECKVFFRSNMLLDFYKRGNKKLKEGLMGSDFFITRGTLSALAGGKGETSLISWAFVLDGVIIISCDNSLNSTGSTIQSYGGLYFETTITSKDGDEAENLNRHANNWEQYKEVYNVDVSLTNGETIRVAYSCEIDAFDKNTMTPLEIKTQYLKNTQFTGGKIFGYNKSVTVGLQCMLGNIHEVVVGYKDEDNVVCKIKKYPVRDILKPSSIGVAITKCCYQLGRRLEYIKKLFLGKKNKGCFKIETFDFSKEFSTTYHPEIVPEVKKLFTEEFCDTFF
uniref:Decapping nuclease n=1 Tax=Strongyloides venezuelensis TaxID=75913 RepID=A0A0K0FVJ0_STRVS